MARAAKRSKLTTPTASPPWTTVQLGAPAPTESDLLSITEKGDRGQASELLVRNGRFFDSYMMATNGGATYEDILRPQTLGSLHLPGSRVTPAAGEEPQGGMRVQLDNVHGGIDERVLIMDTSRIPAKSVGLLRILPADGAYRYGTAWLIGPRTLATAAHNLIHPQAGPTRSLEVAIAFDGTAPRGGWHRVIDNKLSAGWQQAPTDGNPYDFAVIKIENPEVGNRLGWFGFADYEDAKFGNMVVNIFGYPLDLKRFHMYGVAGRILAVDHGRLHYDCDTGAGMSGGPVIARFGQQRIAVGIHVAGGSRSNVGTRITAAACELFEKYRSW